MYPLVSLIKKNKMTKKDKVKKVIQIIWNIGSIIFVSFISGALIINAIKGADEKTQDIVTPNIQEEYKQKRNYGYIDEYGIQTAYFWSDLTGNEFVTAFLEGLISQDSRFDPLYDTSSFTYQFSVVGDIVNYTNGYVDTSNVIAGIGTIKIDRIFIADVSMPNSDPVRQVYYDVYFYSSLGGEMFLLRWYVCTPLMDDSEHDLGSLQVYRTLLIRSNISDLDQRVYYENTNNGFSLFTEYGHKTLLANRVDNFNEGYRQGYNTGYRLGYNIGHESGYNEGLIDGANGITTNAFSVIGQAFGAVSNMLNIQVLPNLPLWVLLTAPLIIAIVIVIVKMIKG